MGKAIFFNEIDNGARQRLIDVQQRAEALRAADGDLRRRFVGSMAWKARDAHEYLYRRNGRVEKSLGPRSPETEEIERAFKAGKALAEERANGLRQTLRGMARVNRAMGLGRVPSLVGRILRRLDEAGVLGEQVCVVGTNALFAYEARAGIRFQSDLLATADIDIALDARRNLALAGRTMPEGLLGLLRKIDASFAPIAAGHFSAVNRDGLMVDLITPEPKVPMRALPRRQRRLGAEDIAAVEDVEAAEVPRLEMIVDAPRFSAVAVAEDGLPVWIAAADPRWWAAHKLWLAEELGREPLKRQRDRDQGLAAAEMLARVWGEVDLSDRALATIPAGLRARLRAAVEGRGGEGDDAPEW
ncbi:GSU2403 family nucleotidyltransferase fold protein [Falsiroseomonas sp. CW058]|uniref:GSU2403 family nucleotidyltransferase fold protein n=1 Tax=Falsiroseomonas sp. CW058 TaxID=3388664 RepID=UPI003D31C937